MSSPPANRYVKTLVLMGAVLGYLFAPAAEARGVGHLSQDEIMNYERSIQQAQQELANVAQQQPQQQQPMAGRLDRLDSDDDDDDDDRAQLQTAADPSAHVQPAGSDLYQTGQTSYQPPLSVGDLRVAASKHHGHKHGAKGWLDMGAWTGKKGAFGWYDKHPVGKGK